MPRHGPRENMLSRQRTLIGVDMLERQVADLTDCLFRIVSELAIHNGVSRETLLDTIHYTRAQGWLLQYIERQRSDYEMGGDDGPETK